MDFLGGSPEKQAPLQMSLWKPQARFFGKLSPTVQILIKHKCNQHTPLFQNTNSSPKHDSHWLYIFPTAAYQGTHTSDMRYVAQCTTPRCSDTATNPEERRGGWPLKIDGLLYLGYGHFLKMHYLDETVEYLRDARLSFLNISRIYSDICSEHAQCFERKGVFCYGQSFLFVGLSQL